VLFRSFKRLQNGSDIRGVALDGVPGEPLTLTLGAAFFIGAAFASWLRAKQPSEGVGGDERCCGKHKGCIMARCIA
jgi:hypothetical protein